MNTLLKSTAGRVVGKAYLSSDHISDATGLDPAIQISKNGGAFANPAAGASVMTEIGNGWYYFELGVSDVDTLGPLIIRATHATMDPMEVVYQVVETVTAANVTQITGTAGNATNLASACSNYSATRGLSGTSLPAAVAGAVSGLVINDGSNAYTQKAVYDVVNGRLPSALTANGNIKASLVEILTTALTETSGLIAAAFKKFFNVATPTGTVNSIPDAVAGATGGLAIVGSVMGKSPATLAAADVSGNLAADLKAITTGVDFSAIMKNSLNNSTPSVSVSLTAGDIEDISDSVVAGVVAAPEISRLNAGTGSTEWVYAVTYGGVGISEVRVSVFSDSTLDTLVARGVTDNFGNITFYLDPGTYYFVSVKAGYSFTNPDTEVVS